MSKIYAISRYLGQTITTLKLYLNYIFPVLSNHLIFYRFTFLYFTKHSGKDLYYTVLIGIVSQLNHFRTIKIIF